MATKKVKQPTMLEVVHEMAKDLYEIDVVNVDNAMETLSKILENALNSSSDAVETDLALEAA